MMRSALRSFGAHARATAMIGDRTDTDVRSGLVTDQIGCTSDPFAG